MSSNKHRPSVLVRLLLHRMQLADVLADIVLQVTDSRERSGQRRPPRRPDTAGGGASRTPMRFMTVDNVLQHNSQIPSGQPRGPPAAAQRPHPAGGSLSITRRVSAVGLPNVHSRAGQPIPSRSTKISEKLVLLPEAQDSDQNEDELEESDLARKVADEEDGPLRDEELDVLRKRGGIRGKSYAERLPKVQRKDKFSRLTAYCTAQAFKIAATSEFLRKKHGARTKLYDDCLYVIYALPLLAGTDGYRVRGRPVLKTPGTGKTLLDLEIERSERRDHHEGYFEDDAYAVPESLNDEQRVLAISGATPSSEETNKAITYSATAQMGRVGPDAQSFAELFVFSYGVVVFWNFTEHQEKDILADLTFADAEHGISLVSRPLEQDDYETEEFHFEYSSKVQRPRVFNDMITLLPRSDHMIKLTISHSIAQSTKLCFFEERMSETMQDAQHVPKTLALTGELNMTRTEIVKIMGWLFKSRVDINLSSNILDVPNFFWDSEPTLHPLYAAVREYLEIDLRIKVLNERCRVFLDLAEILSDSVAEAKMSAITWIIIILIIVSIFVTVTEVGLRFTMLSKTPAKGIKADAVDSVEWAVGGRPTTTPPYLKVQPDPPLPPTPMEGNATPSDGGLESLALMLGLRSNATMEEMHGSIARLQRLTGMDADGTLR